MNMIPIKQSLTLKLHWIFFYQLTDCFCSRFKYFLILWAITNKSKYKLSGEKLLVGLFTEHLLNFKQFC